MSNRNARRSVRKPLSATLRIGWQDSSRTDKCAVTRTFDISESGMRFEMFEPVSLRSDVMLRCDAIGLQSRATVRYCAPKGMKYAVGVEFAGGYRWSPPNEEIRHALEEAEMLIPV